MPVINARNTTLAHVSKAKPLDTSFVSEIISFKEMKTGSIQVVRSGGDVNDGIFKLEVSNICDETTFAPYPLSSVTGCVDQNIIWLFDKIPFLFARLIYTTGTDTTGIADVYAIGKK